MSLKSLNIPVIDFVGRRKYAMIFSAILLIASIASIGLISDTRSFTAGYRVPLKKGVTLLVITIFSISDKLISLEPDSFIDKASS